MHVKRIDFCQKIFREGDDPEEHQMIAISVFDGDPGTRGVQGLRRSLRIKSRKDFISSESLAMMQQYLNEVFKYEPQQENANDDR